MKPWLQEKLNKHFHGLWYILLCRLLCLSPVYFHTDGFAESENRGNVGSSEGVMLLRLPDNKPGVQLNFGYANPKLIPKSFQEQNLAIDRGEIRGKAQKIVVLEAPKSKWNLEIEARSIFLTPTIAGLRSRLAASAENPNLSDPIILRLSSLSTLPLLKQLANQRVMDVLKQPQKARPFLVKFEKTVMERAKTLRLELSKEDMYWLDLEKLSKTLQVASYNPEFSARAWLDAVANPSQISVLNEHFGKSFNAINRKIATVIEKKESPLLPLSVLVPEHLQHLIGHFSAYRGRNCFATALAFQDKGIEYFRNINIVRENQHHSSMINNDEFHNALWLGYTELTNHEIDFEGIKFGDVLVFYEKETYPGYESLRHAVVHLAGDFYFHKQSKSASSPIEITRWGDLVTTWSGLTQNLGYKVYRRIPKLSLRKESAKLAIEKLNWKR